MIINLAQLRAINEDNTTSKLIATTAAEAKPAVQTAMAQEPGKDVTVQITDATPGTEKNKGFSPDVNSTSPQQMKNYGWMTFSSNNNGTVFEGTKRQVELGRILEMRRTGKVYSKKQLNEMFMEIQEYEKRFDGIGRCMPWDVFDAVEEIFGPEARQKVDSCVSGDPKACIKELFMAADTDTQEEFLDRLGL